MIVAVWGMEFAMRASLAGAVPGMDARTPALALLSGMLEKPVGKLLPSTNVHGPFARDSDLN